MAAMCNGDAPVLFRDDDAQRIALLAHAQCGAVAQAQLLWNVKVVAYGQYASCGLYAVF